MREGEGRRAPGLFAFKAKPNLRELALAASHENREEKTIRQKRVEEKCQECKGKNQHI